MFDFHKQNIGLADHSEFNPWTTTYCSVVLFQGEGKIPGLTAYWSPTSPLYT